MTDNTVASDTTEPTDEEIDAVAEAITDSLLRLHGIMQDIGSVLPPLSPLMDEVRLAAAGPAGGGAASLLTPIVAPLVLFVAAFKLTALRLRTLLTLPDDAPGGWTAVVDGWEGTTDTIGDMVPIIRDMYPPMPTEETS